MFNVAPYRKTVAALAAAALSWGYIVVESPSAAITSHEWIGLAGLALGALGVYRIPNQP